MYWETRRFYLTGDITNPYPLIHYLKSVRIRSYSGPYFPSFELNTNENNSEYGHFLCSVSELFSSDVSLRGQYKYIAFIIFLFRILIISHKMLIITGVSNGKTNELVIYAILCRNVAMFHRQNLDSFKCRKNWKPAEIQNETFRVAV